MQTGTDKDAAMTAFITLALNRSLQFLPEELQANVVRLKMRMTLAMWITTPSIENEKAVLNSMNLLQFD